MSYELAVQLLDLVRAGCQLPLSIINQALELTGDLGEVA